MKKLLLNPALGLLIILLIVPVITTGQTYDPRQGLVPCGNAPGPNAPLGTTGPCTIEKFFTMLALIFNFIVFWIATPLAVLMLTIGGVMLVISGGNPNLAGLGKKILWVSVIGLALVFCAWLIVNFILITIGYKRTWNIL